MGATVNSRDLLMGLRAHLAANGVTATVVVGRDLPTRPDSAVALNIYDSDDAVEIARGTHRVQAMFRGDPDDSLSADDVADLVFDLWHAREGLWLDGLHVALMTRVSRIPLGADGNNRSMRSDNYELLVDEPESALRTF